MPSISVVPKLHFRFLSILVATMADGIRKMSRGLSLLVIVAIKE